MIITFFNGRRINATLSRIVTIAILTLFSIFLIHFNDWESNNDGLSGNLSPEDVELINRLKKENLPIPQVPYKKLINYVKKPPAELPFRKKRNVVDDDIGNKLKTAGDEIRALMKKDKKNKVLLLGYPRSGSSFISEVLATNPKSSYLFEPLWIYKTTYNYIPQKTMTNYIQGLFYCQEDALAKAYVRRGFKILRNHHVNRKKKDFVCKEADPLVMKTIRLRGNMISPWIAKSKVKVVHLVRDPRAVYKSIPKQWGTKDAKMICGWYRNDLRIRKILPKNRYFMLKYEDMVDHVDKTSRKIYSFLGLPLDEHVKKYIQAHTNSSVKKEGYRSTYRSSGFDYNRWKKSLSIEEINLLESECDDVLKTLNYSKYDPKEEEKKNKEKKKKGSDDKKDSDDD